jgi:hypothetical protein
MTKDLGKKSFFLEKPQRRLLNEKNIQNSQFIRRKTHLCARLMKKTSSETNL